MKSNQRTLYENFLIAIGRPYIKLKCSMNGGHSWVRLNGAYHCLNCFALKKVTKNEEIEHRLNN